MVLVQEVVATHQLVMYVVDKVLYEKMVVYPFCRQLQREQCHQCPGRGKIASECV